MKHRSLSVLSVGAGSLAVLILVCVLLTPASASTPQDKVTICHATSSVENPYGQTMVHENSIVMSNGHPHGHGEHSGPIYPQPEWGDIIPPFEYANNHGGTSIYPGLDWNSGGQAIWNGGCLVDLMEPEPPETTTTTTQPAVTTTTSASTTTTVPPGSSTSRPAVSTTTTSALTTSSSSAPSSTTSRPQSTTTTVPPRTTPTTAPASERPPPLPDPGPGIEVMPPTQAVVVGPRGAVVDLGMLSDSQRVKLETFVDTYGYSTTTTTQPSAPLASTGLNATPLFLTAALLMLVGTSLCIGSRRKSGRSVGKR